MEVLKEAPDPDTLCKALDHIIEDIKQHATDFNLPDRVQEEILHLCHQLPNRTLQKYENYLVKVEA